MKRISVLLILGVLGTMLFSGTAVAENGAISLIPVADVVKKDMVFEVDVWANNVDNLYGLQLHLQFDKSQLEVVGFRPELFGWEKGIHYYEFHKWDNDRGTFDMVFTCCGSDMYFSGSGKLGTIEFKVIGTNNQLTITENYLGYPGRTCIGVNSQSQPTEYSLNDARIFNDNTPPNIDNIEVIDNSTIRVEFNEPLDEESAIDVSNYIITPDLGVRSAHLDESGKIVTLVTDPQVGNRLYELIAMDVQDLMGNKTFDILRKNFRGAMRLWLEAVESIYNRNRGIVQLKAGPVEEMTQLKFYIKYDGNYIKYEAVRCENENFSPNINNFTEPPYMYFGGTLNPALPVSQYDDWVVCEFEILPQNVGSTNLEFITNSSYRAPEAYGRVDGSVERIAVDHSDEVIDILQSYQLTGYVKLVTQYSYYDLEAYLVQDKLEKLEINIMNGSFQLENLIPGIYTVRLSKPGYLTMDYSFDIQCDTVENVSMIAGDLNNDGKINICDIAKICKKFSTKMGTDGWDAAMNFNGDQWIDIIDISIVARNYGKVSNVNNVMR